MADTDTTPKTADPAPQTAAAPTEQPPAAAKDGGLGEAGQKALKAERDARRAAEKAANDALAKVKQFEDRDKSELERLTEQAAKATADADAARAEALRLRVAAESGLPTDLHEFLVGDDEEALRAKAQKLMAATAAADGARRPAPDPTQGAKPQSGPDQLTRADLARMSPQQIDEARESGRLNDLMGAR